MPNRVWNVHFSITPLGEFKKSLGAKHEIHEQFKRLLAWLIQHLLEVLKDGGDRDNVYITTWPSPASIHQYDIYQIKWTKPKDEFLQLEAYIKTKGDPDLNGLGHTKETGPGGVVLVNMGNNGVWQKEISTIYRSEKKRIAW